MKRVGTVGGLFLVALMGILWKRSTAPGAPSEVQLPTQEAFSLNSFDLSRFDSGQGDADTDEAHRPDDVELHVDLSEKVSRRNRIRANISLVNNSAPYFPLALYGREIEIEIHNARGERCEPTAFGQEQLPRRSSDGGVINGGGSGIMLALLPRQSHQWTIEIGKCFHLANGQYTLQAIFPVDHSGFEPIRSQVYEFEVVGKKEPPGGDSYVSLALPSPLPTVRVSLVEANTIGLNSLILLEDGITTIGEHELRPLALSSDGDEESGSIQLGDHVEMKAVLEDVGNEAVSRLPNKN